MMMKFAWVAASSNITEIIEKKADEDYFFDGINSIPGYKA